MPTPTIPITWPIDQEAQYNRMGYYITRLRQAMEADIPIAVETMRRVGVSPTADDLDIVEIPELPPVPGNVATEVKPFGVLITWTHPVGLSGEPDPTIKAYDVQRAADANFTNSVVSLGRVAGLQLVDFSVVPGQTWWYRVRSVRETENKVSDWSTAVVAIIPPVGTTEIADAAITEVKIQDAAVSTAKVADLAVTSAKIADLAVTTAKIAALAVGTAQIADLAVTNAKIDDLAVTEAKIGNLAVTEGKIGNLAVTTAKINDLAVTTAKIDNLSVTEGKIGNLAVTTGKIQDLAVTEAKIANLAVTTGKINDLAVTDAKIANATISNSKIQNATITGAKIANATITDAHIASLSATKITAGTITADIAIGAGENILLDGQGDFIEIYDEQVTPRLRLKLGALNKTLGHWGLSAWTPTGVPMIENSLVQSAGIAAGAVSNEAFDYNETVFDTNLEGGEVALIQLPTMTNLEVGRRMTLRASGEVRLGAGTTGRFRIYRWNGSGWSQIRGRIFVNENATGSPIRMGWIVETNYVPVQTSEDFLLTGDRAAGASTCHCNRTSFHAVQLKR